jgi:hypothetical protein
LKELRELIRTLTSNEPIPLRQLRPPSASLTDYSAVAIVDASACAWAAYVVLPARSRTVLLQQRWASAMGRSAHAEPRAALSTIRWIVQQGEAQRIAVVTDHAALATGQRRWWSENGGFGRSYWINTFYEELYAASPEAEIFFVDGTENIADAPSRDPKAKTVMTVEDVNIIFPALENFSHPYWIETREKWQV